MKIQFDKLDYQDDAIKSSIDILKGNMVDSTDFIIENNNQQGSILSEKGWRNKINIDEEIMLNNLKQIQIKNDIPPSINLYGNDYDIPMFNIEMETGTGKTFVYLKTILKLNQEYGLKKFIIVVPTIAIKEGVVKTYEMTKQTFSKSFQNINYNLFTYDSSKLDQIKSFATSNTIEIMVITMDSFNKPAEARFEKDSHGNTNVIFRKNDKMEGYRPIDLIREVNPILIIDEPQVVDNTPLARQSISRLNPCLGFRYSATHRDKSFPTLYKLGAVEAYQNELVKQIEVSSVQLDVDGNEAYINVRNFNIGKNGPTARIELYKKQKNIIAKKVITLKKGDNLFKKTKLPVYEKVGFVTDINATPEKEYIEFSGDPRVLTLRDSLLDDLEIKRLQIRKSITAHLDKELILNKKGVKVLTLFFLDKVANYRVYSDETSEKGRYAKIFEEEYKQALKSPKYKNLLDYDVPVDEVHDGYFAKDSKGNIKDSKSGTAKDDRDAYEIIMKDKEGLLTQFNIEKGQEDSAHKIRFIFSHSALKEGWDNPNVFQICTLVDTKDEITKRQKIGRGLRIAVNQEGKRVPGFGVNTLTVIANESYEEFAIQLQKEYEEDGVVFGIFDSDTFATIILDYDEITETTTVLGKEKSRKLVTELKAKKYLDDKNRATDKLKRAIKENNIELSHEFQYLAEQILAKSNKKVRTLDIKNAKNRKSIKVNKEALSADFIELWDKIKQKTTYRFEFDSNQLISNILEGVRGEKNIHGINVTRPKYRTHTSRLEIDDSGIEGVEESYNQITSTKEVEYKLPDIVTYLQNETQLTRKTIVKLLKQVPNYNLFSLNPISYMSQIANLINIHKRILIFEGVKYEKVDEYYEQSLFTQETLDAYLDKDFKVDISKNKTTHNFIQVDSKIEYKFAKDCELDESIRYYIKLPNEFKIRTPLGNYNPDWAILKEEENEQKLYFIVETKGTPEMNQLRLSEVLKIESGKKHFHVINPNISFKVTDKLDKI